MSSFELGDQLGWLFAFCKCEVSITINQHRNYYQTAREWLDDQASQDPDLLVECGADVEARMVASDTVVSVVAYNRTPVGSYRILHYSLEEAVRLMVETIRAEDQPEVRP